MQFDLLATQRWSELTATLSGAEKLSPLDERADQAAVAAPELGNGIAVRIGDPQVGAVAGDRDGPAELAVVG